MPHPPNKIPKNPDQAFFPKESEFLKPDSLESQRFNLLDVQQEVISLLSAKTASHKSETVSVIDKAKMILLGQEYNDSVLIHEVLAGSDVTREELANDDPLTNVSLGLMPAVNEKGEPIHGIPALRFTHYKCRPDGQITEAYAWVPIANPETGELAGKFTEKDFNLVSICLSMLDDAREDNGITAMTPDMTGVDRIPDEPYIITS